MLGVVVDFLGLNAPSPNLSTKTQLEKCTHYGQLDYIISPAHCCITQPPVAPSGDSARVIA